MKKKKISKPKSVLKKQTIHWSAWDEPAWGPQQIAAFLDEFLDAIENDNIITVKEFLARKRLRRTYFFELLKKHPQLKGAYEVIQDAIYGKRHQLVLKGANPAFLKDLFRYAPDEVEQDFTRDQMYKDAQQERKKELATHISNIKRKEDTKEFADIDFKLTL